MCWGSAAIGGIASAYFSGSLVETYGVRFVFGMTALFPLIVSGSALLIDEQRVGGAGFSGSRGPTAAAELGRGNGAGGGSGFSGGSVLLQQLKTQGVALWGAFSTRSILLPTIFVFLWQVGLRVQVLAS